jgi:hypothetical protein
LFEQTSLGDVVLMRLHEDELDQCGTEV